MRVVSFVFPTLMEISWLMSVSVHALQWTLESIFELVTCMYRLKSASRICFVLILQSSSITLCFNGTFSFPGILRLPA